MLEDLGHEVVGVASGESALAIIQEEGDQIDLVIADHLMPGMTGLELANTLRTLRPCLPVILATGHSELPVDAGPTLPRLTKPFDQRQLAQAARACLRPEPPASL
jgi:CheY-like chemotaxis protein